MSYKQLIVPIGTALAALIANTSEASIVPSDSQSEPQEKTAAASTKSTDPILQRLAYQIREQTHTLTLHKSAADVLYAEHGSHRSHGSHQSHSSHRSGY